MRKIHLYRKSSSSPLIFKVPEQIAFEKQIPNPALPPGNTALRPSRFRPPKSALTTTNGLGSKRVYLDVQSRPQNVAYPPRPVPGSVADLDIIMNNCDFSENKVYKSSASGHFTTHVARIVRARLLGGSQSWRRAGQR